MQKRETTLFVHFKQMLCLGMCCVAIGTLLLTLVFCLPVETVKRHVVESTGSLLADTSEETGTGIQEYIQKNRETFTDAIMVQNAFERITGKNPYEHAMWMYHLDLDPELWTPEATLKYLSEGGTSEGMFLHQYSRYWHGYLVYLKPLLLLFNLRLLLWLGAGLQFTLTLALILLACKARHPELGLTVVIGLLFMKPLLMLVSFDLSVCWLITLAALFIILFRHERLVERERYPEFFLMIGILVAYFDFLTYPIVTLGFSLCAFFLMQGKEKLTIGFREGVGQMLTYSACWALGYVSMWASKWVLADLTLHTGTIKSAFSSILGWTEAIGGRPRFSGGFYVIGLNLGEYDSMLYPLMAVLLLLFDITVFVWACRRASLKRAVVCCVPYLLIACLPFAWYIVVQHHSGLHIAFTFRNIGVASLALGAMGFSLLRLEKKEATKSQS